MSNFKAKFDLSCVPKHSAMEAYGVQACESNLLILILSVTRGEC
jgi:hypothetical protein